MFERRLHNGWKPLSIFWLEICSQCLITSYTMFDNVYVSELENRPLCLTECFSYYHLCMWVGNVFSHVCLSVCLSVCPSVQAITFELLHTETSILVCRYIFTMSRSSLIIKVIGLRSRSYEQNDNFTYYNMLILCMWLQVINKVKFIHQGEGHIKVKVKYLHSFKFYVVHTLCSLYCCCQ